MSRLALEGDDERPAPGRVAAYARAARLPYLSASVIPTGLGLAAAIGDADAVWWAAPLALVAAMLVHTGTNVVNGVVDYERGVDTVDMEGDARAFVDGELTAAQGRAFYRLCFLGSILLGLALVAITGPALLLVGTVGVLGGWAYTGGPWPYKYHALGDVLIVPLMGPLMSLGGFTAITGELWDADAFLLGLVPGLLIGAVISGNNLADIEEDRGAGVRTVAGVVGFTWARRIYLALLALGLLAVPALVLAGVAGPPALVALAAVPLAWRRAMLARAATGPGDPRLAPLAPLTALVHLVAGTLLLVAEVAYRLAT